MGQTGWHEASIPNVLQQSTHQSTPDHEPTALLRAMQQEFLISEMTPRFNSLFYSSGFYYSGQVCCTQTHILSTHQLLFLQELTAGTRGHHALTYLPWWPWWTSEWKKKRKAHGAHPAMAETQIRIQMVAMYRKKKEKQKTEVKTRNIMQRKEQSQLPCVKR